jgi:hypothetical protein
MTNRISATSIDHFWYCVETPGVFREIKLLANDADWSAADKRKFKTLEDLAEIHGTYVKSSTYRRG